MASQFTLPELGESTSSGTLVKMLVSQGDTIEEDQSVLELETDKAVTEVPSTVSGIVGEILVKPGQKLSVGDPVFALTESAGASAPPAAEPAKAEAAAPAVQAAANGSAATETAPAAPAASNATASNGHGASNGSATSNAGARIAAAPSVRRLAREMGIDLAQVSPTGEHGRITYADVSSFLKNRASAGGGIATGVAIPPLPDFSKWGETETNPLSGVRLATAKHMARCWAEVPHVTQFDKADITDLEKLRKQFGAQVEKSGAKLTPTAILLKVVASALRKFPDFNSSLDLANEQIVRKKFINIGVAVDTPRGLLVPVIRDVDQKNIVQLAQELTQLSETARSGKTALADMQGGTFTITNLGGIGGTGFTPIVNAPEVAILGVARGTQEPFWNGTAFEPRLMMPLCLSYDHRVIDGANGARFLRWIAAALEQPFVLSLEG
jgi:pyruvate dehydrogenase E2 component (dihydrolipoamide acetyltransferase)